MISSISAAMARTSRGGAASASVNALDKIDLDDMLFGDEGNDIFEEFELDLDLDEITGGGGDLDTRNRAAGGRLAVPRSAPAAPATASSTAARRTTNRKSKTPAFLDDAADEDFIDDPTPAPKKRKRKAKAVSGTAKKKGAKAAPAPAPAAKEEKTKLSKEKPTTSKGKGKSKSESKSAAALAQLPLVKGTSLAGVSVAPAGRYGAQLQTSKNRSSSFTTAPKAYRAKLPMASKATTGKAGRVQSAPAKAAAAVAATIADLKASHPGLEQGPDCGMQPSNTLFYPFLPTMPPEPTMKSRKIYLLVDRIHTAFLSHLQSPPATSDTVATSRKLEPICELMQEAYKEEKPAVNDDNASNSVNSKASAVTRASAVGHAVSTLQKTISQLNVPKMAVDWYAVCALLQRQHDFLKLNKENMERWCKENFSQADYAEVYLEPEEQEEQEQQHPSKKRKAAEIEKSSVLLSFGKRELQIKIHCTGFKQPKAAGPLMASLPLSFLPESMRPKEKAKKKKKRKLASVLDATEVTKPSAVAAPDTTALGEPASRPTQPLTYQNMKPGRRRKHVADTLSRIAGELEKANLSRLDARRDTVDREQTALRKLVENDAVPVSHTTGLWKWLEMSGYFKLLSGAELQRIFDEIRSPEPSILQAVETTGNEDRRMAKSSLWSTPVKMLPNDDSLLDRLQSLLVEECVDEHDAMDTDGEDFFDYGESYTLSETMDMSELTLDERSFLHLQNVGLGNGLAEPPSIQFKRSLVEDESPQTALPLQSGDVFASTTSCADKIIMNGSSSKATTKLTAQHKTLRTEAATDVHDAGEKSSLPTMFTSLPQPSLYDFESSELGQVISSMTAHLAEVNKVNNRRASFLQKVSNASFVLLDEQKLKSDQETSVIARYQALLKKTKEINAKNGKMAKKDDGFALPW